MKKTRWICWLLLLCLALPALAVQENVVVPLPIVEPLKELKPQATSSPYSVERMASYYGVEQEGSPAQWQTYQSPQLSPEEILHLEESQRQYDTGKRPEGSALEKTEGVQVGVYALRPEDYEGQQVYTLLPGRELTGNELLQLIDAYTQLGLTFTPENLSFRNCARGGGVEASRFWQEDERQRRAILTDLYRRQGTRPDTPFTPHPGDDGMGSVSLLAEDYAGLDEFGFYPYRQMTDEELLRLIDYWEEGETVEPTQYAANEKRTRQELARLLNAPLSLERTSEEMGIASQNTVYLESIPVYNAWFTSATGEDSYFAMLDPATDRVVFAWPQFSVKHLKYSDLHLDPYDQKWQDIAQAYIEGIRQDGVQIASIQSRGEVAMQNIGFGAGFAITMEDNSYYDVTVAYQTERVEGGVMYLMQPPRPETYETMYGEGENG